MSNFLPLLIELGTEELPPKALPDGAGFFRRIAGGFEKRGIEFNKKNAKALYSPRRLACCSPKSPLTGIAEIRIARPVFEYRLNAKVSYTALLGFCGQEWPQR